MEFVTLLTFTSDFASHYKYLLVFFGAIFEGPILMVACGFLYRLGVFNLALLYAALVFGDLVGDIAWYYVGYFFAGPFLRRFGRFFGINADRLEKAHGLFHTYKNSILIISKITVGFGMALAIIVFAGSAKIPMRIFLTLNALGEMLMVALLLTAGYFLGHLYLGVESGYKIYSLVGIILFVLAILFGFSRYMKEIIMKKVQ